MSALLDLIEEARGAFAQAATPAQLEDAKARFLGKSGRLTELMKGLAALSVDEKKSRGAEINQAKQQVEALLTGRRAELAEAELSAQLKAEALDVSLPGRTACGAARAAKAACTPSRAPSSASRPSLAPWASTWPTAPRSKPTG
jgi:phenylalanyl-tRNA synthetase alpha subunit